MEVDVYVFVCISVQKSFKDAFLYILHGHFEHEIAQVPDSIFKDTGDQYFRNGI